MIDGMTTEAARRDRTRARAHRTGRRAPMGAALAALASLTLFLAAPGLAQQKPSPGSKQLARGRYLVTIMDCSGCHTGGALAGKPDAERFLAGSEIGFGLGPAAAEGVVYPRNLTPDRETGLGAWSDQEIVQAIRQGKSRDGRALIPVMPWPHYASLTDQDVRAIVAYLRSIRPVRFEVPKNVKPGEKPTAPYLDVVVPR